MKMRGNKTHKAVWFLLILFLIVFIVAGCSSGATDKSDSSEDTNVSGKKTDDAYAMSEENSNVVPVYDDEILEILENEELSEETMELLSTPVDYESLEKTTYAKLHKAFEVGEISEEEYSKLLILQDFEPESTPQQYSGADGYESINYAYQYISNNWDNLDQSTKELLEPYLVPISDPKSYYFINDFENEIILKKPSSNDEKALIKTAHAAGASKVLVEHEFYVDHQQFTIVYYEYNSWDEEKKLEYNMCVDDIEDAIVHSYNRFEQLLTVSLTKPVWIELAPMKKKAYGKAWVSHNRDGTSFYRIMIGTSHHNNPIDIKGTAAHELFHNFQYEMGLRYKPKDLKWLKEATATWAENYAYEEYNSEHIYLKIFFRTLNHDRINFGDNFEYGSYMFFYYFSDYGQYDIVPEILWGTVREGGAYIRNFLTDEVANMKEQYADYAFINLNFGIAQEYYDHAYLSQRPSGKAFYKLFMKSNEDTKTVTLKPGALQYYYYVFDSDDKIQHVEFEFEKDFSDDKYIKRQAFVKLDDGWHLEDWSFIDEVKYCRLRESKNEKIQQIILIYSNSNFQKHGTNNPVDEFKVTTEKCPSEMEITIDAEWEYTNEDFVYRGNATLEDTVKVTDHTFYISKNCNFEMQGNGVLEGETIIETTGSYSGQVADPTIENSMVRLIKPMDKGLDDVKIELEEFGLYEDTPEGGILTTVPSVKDSDNLKGSTTIYFPEPEGTVEMDGPLCLYGLCHYLAVEIDENDWSSEGFSSEMTLDYFSHNPPILDWFEVDFGQLQGMLSSMDGMGGTGAQDVNKMLEDSGIDLEDLEGLDELLPETDIEGGDPLNKTFGALTDMMMGARENVDGITSVIKIKISGRYTKFN